MATRPRYGFRPSSYLFDKQCEFVEDPSPFKIAVTTRRAGKTVSCAFDLLHTARKNKESVCIYITLSSRNAKRLIWPELKRIDKEFALNAEFLEGELAVKLPNGSIVYCMGANDKSAIENFRGMAIKKVYLDECQSFPSYIAELIDDVLAPALMDYNGSLCLIGTPGPIPSGFFYDCSKSNAWKQFSWTFWDNPHIPIKSGKTHQELLDRELKRRGVSTDNPSIQREWFGRWVLDSDALVYKFDSKKNVYDSLPVNTKWNYILGVDLGFEDADALAVLAWSEATPVAYLVEELIVKQQGLTELTTQIDNVVKKYDVGKIVVDTGGLGKKIHESISSRYKVPMVPAEKVRKAEYIELMNDALRTSTLLAKANSRFALDCMRVEWDLDKSTPDRKVISKRFHSDICEAVLYAWRDVYSYTYSKQVPKPVYGSVEYASAEVERMEAEALEYFQNLEDATKADPFGDF